MPEKARSLRTNHALVWFALMWELFILFVVVFGTIHLIMPQVGESRAVAVLAVALIILKANDLVAAGWSSLDRLRRQRKQPDAAQAV